MNKKILYGFLPVFLVLVFFICPLNTYAADNGASGTMWDGDLVFSNDIISIPLHYTYNNLEITNSSGNTLAEYKSSSFIGKASPIFYIIGTPGTYINGWAQTVFTFQAFNDYPGHINVTCAENQYDGVRIATQINQETNNITKIYVYVMFDNFEILSDTTTYVLNLDINYTCTYEEVYHIVPPVVDVDLKTTDWVDAITMYGSVKDLNGSKGFFGRAIDSLKSHLTYLFTEQTNSINANTQANNELLQQNSQNEIANANQNSLAQINQSIENTDQITNGYNSDVMGESEDKFSSGAGDLTDIEDSLTDSSSGYVNSFTSTGFDTSFLQSVGPSLNYVVTWFTNFWNMGGALTSTYGLCFAVFIGFYILRVRG